MDLQNRIDEQDKLIQELKNSIISFTNMHNYNMSILQNYVTILQNYIASNDNNIRVLEDRIKMIQLSVAPPNPNPMTELDKLCKEAEMTIVKQAKVAKATKANKKSIIINKLKRGIKKAGSYKIGGSKYMSITLQNNRWTFAKNILNPNPKIFKTKKDAENYYEQIIAKHDIPVEYITRNGYDPSMDEDAIPEEVVEDEQED